MHLGCSTFGKRKNTLACGSSIFTLSESLATSLVHGSRNPARKPFGIPLIPLPPKPLYAPSWDTHTRKILDFVSIKITFH